MNWKNCIDQSADITKSELVILITVIGSRNFVGPWLNKQVKIKEEKGARELLGRHNDFYWVEVSKREEKMERSPRNQAIGRGD
jgi:hypothetical protein